MSLNTTIDGIRQALTELRTLPPQLHIPVDPTNDDDVELPLTAVESGEVLVRDYGGKTDGLVAYTSELPNDLQTFIRSHWEWIKRVVDERVAHADAGEKQDWEEIMSTVWRTLGSMLMKAQNGEEQYAQLWENYVVLRNTVDRGVADIEELLQRLDLIAQDGWKENPTELVFKLELVQKELSDLKNMQQVKSQKKLQEALEKYKTQLAEEQKAVTVGKETLERERMTTAALRKWIKEQERELAGKGKGNKKGKSKNSTTGKEHDKAIRAFEKRIGELEADLKKAQKEPKAPKMKDNCETVRRQLKGLKQHEVRPMVLDYTDEWFKTQWNTLYTRIGEWVNMGYRHVGTPDETGPNDLPASFFTDLALYDDCDPLVAIYGREVAVNGADMIRLWNAPERNYRQLICIGLVYRILHEEVFEATRKFLTIELPDPVSDWIDKEQHVGAFLVDGPDEATSASGLHEREASSWRKRKYNEILTRCNENPMGTNGGVDVLKATEEDFQILELQQATGPEAREAKRRKRFDIFQEMEMRGECSEQMKVFHTVRAKMMKTIFTIVDDPMHEHTRAWRSSVVNLIFDTLEPARITSTIAGQLKLEPHEWSRKDQLKNELWGIVKTAFDLAVTMRCQRTCYYTRMPTPITDIHYDGDWMHHLGSENFNIEDPEVRVYINRSLVLPLPYSVMPVGKVRLTVVPALCKRGDGIDFRMETEHTLAKLGVLAHVDTPAVMAEWAQEVNGLDYWEQIVARATRSQRERQLQVDAFEKAQKASKEWNPYHDNLFEENATSLKDLVPRKMRVADAAKTRQQRRDETRAKKDEAKDMRHTGESQAYWDRRRYWTEMTRHIRPRDGGPWTHPEPRPGLAPDVGGDPNYMSPIYPIRRVRAPQNVQSATAPPAPQGNNGDGAAPTGNDPAPEGNEGGEAAPSGNDPAPEGDEDDIDYEKVTVSEAGSEDEDYEKITAGDDDSEEISIFGGEDESIFGGEDEDEE